MEFDWVSSFSRGPFDEIHGAMSADVERAVAAVLPFFQIRDITLALEALGPVAAGNPNALRALRRRFDRIEVQGADAQNRIFELEIAGRLARNGVPVRFDEPDIVAAARPFGRFALACKRPQNLLRIRERIEDGARQVGRHGRRGFVVVDLQPSIFKAEDRQRRTKFYELHGDADLRMELECDADGRIAVVSEEVHRARAMDFVEGVVFGVMGWGIGTVSRRDTYEWAWVARPGIPATPAERRLCELLCPQAL